MIFSNSHKNGSSLHDGMEEVLEGLNNCLSITERVAEKSPSPNFQKGSDCLSAMRHEIEKIDSKLTSRQTLSR
jgi:hypothetical protein